MLVPPLARNLRRFRPLPVVLIALAPVLGLATEPAATEPPLELPKFVVTDQRPLPPPESWRYAQIPGIEILSATTDRQTQKLLRDFQLFNDAVGVVWPAMKMRRPVPMSLILCGPGKDFTSFIPGGQSPVATERASLLLRGPEQVAIVLNFAVKDIDLATQDATVSVSTADADPDAALNPERATLQVDYYRQLYREYIRYQLSFSQPRLPAWLEEGLIQLLSSMRVEPKFIEFARIENPNLLPPGGAAGPPVEDDFNRALRSRGLIPLDRFFAVPHDSPETNNPMAGQWAKQAQGLVHMWLYGEGRKYNQAFAQFVARATREPVTEAMFKECFKLGYADMLLAFRLYLDNTAYRHQQFEAGKGGGLPEPAPLVLRDATQPEIGRIKGEAQVIAGHSDLARDAMLAPYARGEVDGPLLASLGLLEKSRNEPARARKLLEAAAKAQVVNPRAYLELAELRLAEAQPSPDGPLLTAAQTQAVLQPLQIARKQPPPLPEIYELIADVWLRSETPPTKEDLALLNQAVQHFQRRPLLLLRVAELDGKYGNVKDAHMLADFGLQLARTPEARQAFEAVKAALPPLPSK